VAGGGEGGGHCESVPFVLFPDVILFAEIDKVGDGFGGEQLKTIDHVDLCAQQTFSEGKRSSSATSTCTTG
jgi:hypothetical protein